MASRRTRRNWWMLLVVLALLNVPILMSLATSARVSASGADVTAEVVGGRLYGDEADPAYWLSYRFEEAVDEDRQTYSAQVDRATYRRASESRELGATVVPGDAAAHRVEGQVPRRLGLWLTLGTDAIVALGVLVVWLRRRARPEPPVDPMPQSSP